MKKQILVIGSLNTDMVVEMARIPEIGETVLGESLAYIPGGKGANQACAAGKLGARVKMLGSVGDDSFGRQQIENLSRAGVDMSEIKVTGRAPTGTAVIYVDQKGNNDIVVVPGANSLCDVEYLQKYDQLFQESDFLIFQMEIPFEAAVYGIRRGKELGKTVILNPAPAPEFLPDELLKGLDYITPNETELRKLCGLSDTDRKSLEKGAEILLGKGVKNVLVTLGEQGALLAGPQKTEFFPAFSVKAIDTTAAGDCFNGAFAAALASGMEKGEAISFASLASSIAVTRKGAQSSIPTLEEVEEKRKEYQAEEVKTYGIAGNY